MRELTLQEMDLCTGGFSFKEHFREEGRKLARKVEAIADFVGGLFD